MTYRTSMHTADFKLNLTLIESFENRGKPKPLKPTVQLPFAEKDDATMW